MALIRIQKTCTKATTQQFRNFPYEAKSVFRSAARPFRSYLEALQSETKFTKVISV